jgi:hypothetical protein
MHVSLSQLVSFFASETKPEAYSPVSSDGGGGGGGARPAGGGGGGGGSTASLILNLGRRWNWEVNMMSWSPYPGKKTRAVESQSE